MKFSIVIPCYNEGPNVPLLIEEYAKLVKTPDIEVIVVNNGSKDDTAQVLTELAQKYSFLKPVTVEVNQGYGFGILSGLKSATGDYIGWTHGDMQTPPANVLKAFELIKSTNTYVKGKRYGRPLFDKIFTWGMSAFESLYLHSWLYDINAQPNVFHRSFYETWQNPPFDFSLDLYVLYQAKKAKLDIVRFDVPFLKRIHGESHWNKNFTAKWKFIKRTLDFSIKLKKNNLV